MLSVLNNTTNHNTFTSTKCAEVYCQPLEQFSITCTFCGLKTSVFDEFLLHFKSVHLGKNETPPHKVTIKCEPDATSNELFDATEFHEQLQDIKEMTAAPDVDIKPYDNIAATPLDIDPIWKEEQDHNGIGSSSNSDMDNDKRKDDDYAPPTEHNIKAENPPRSDVYACSKCEKFFMSKSRWTQHLITHTEERAFKCSICKFSFKRDYILKAHMLRHTDHKKFNCESCEKKFFNRAELTEHFRAHTGERPYICPYCGKTYQTSGSLGAHIKRHNNVRPYKCQFCQKSFFSNDQLKNHMPVHTNERPFLCSTCSASFPRRKALAQHMKLHINAREYVCNICEKSFNQKPAMLTHIRLTHKVIETSEHGAVQRPLT